MSLPFLYKFVRQLFDILNLILLQINFVELSPNYAGTLMGISNGIATICGFVSPMVAGAIVNDNVSNFLHL